MAGVRRGLGIFCLSLALIAQIAAASTTRPTTQPQTLEFPLGDFRHLILIPAEWRLKSGYFMLDTGASTSVLDETAFPDLVAFNQIDDVNGPNGKQTLQGYQPPDLQVGPVNLKRVGYVVLRRDLSDFSAHCGKNILGIFGVTAMKHWVVQMDFDNHRVRFISPDENAHPEWGHALPMPFEAGAPAIAMNLLGHDWLVGLDSGSVWGMALPAEEFERWRAAGDAQAFVNFTTTLFGRNNSQCMRWPFLDVAGFKYPGIIVEQSQFAFASLGIPFLARNLATFDFPHSLFYIKPGKDFARPEPIQTNAPEVYRINSQTCITGLTSIDPLYSAGVRDNDILLTVNDKLADDWDTIDLSLFLQSRDGRDVTLTFRHGDRQPQTVNVLLKSEESATNPSDETSRRNLDLIKNLQTKPPMELSTARSSIADKFCFEWTFDATDVTNTGTGEILARAACRTIIVRNRDRVAMLYRTLDRKCYAYTTNGLLLILDHEHPGRIISIAPGNPDFVAQSAADGTLQHVQGFVTNTDSPQLVLAVNDMITRGVRGATSASYDRAHNAYTIELPQDDSCRLELDPNRSAFPVKSFALIKTGSSLWCSIFSPNSIPDSCSHLIADPAAVLQKLTDMGIQLENLSGNQLDSDLLVNLLTRPHDVGKDPREAAVVAKLTALFLPHDPTTQPD